MRFFRTDRRGNPISWRPQRKVSRKCLPPLFSLIENRSWPEVVRRCRTHPHETTVQEDLSGNTALHMACRLDPPPEVVRALSQASTISNSEGAIPLHVAATHRCSKEAMQALLNIESGKLPPSQTLTKMRRAPIHYACMSFRGISLEAFQLLVEATLKTMEKDGDLLDDEDEDYLEDGEEPKVNVLTLRDSTGQTPLGLLFRRYRERVRCVIQTIERLRKENRPIAAALTVQADFGELWEKARWIVTLLTDGLQPPLWTELDSPGEEEIAQEAAKWALELSCPPKKRFRIVHASVSLTGYGCPPEMIRLAISLHPEQVQERGNDGSLPLHVWAVASTLFAGSSSDDDTNMSIFSDLSFLSGSCASATPRAFDKVLRILLQHFPAAARIPHATCGRLPLALAMDHRSWEDGLETLLDAYPAALESRKFSCSLYPCIMQKLGNRSIRKSLNSVFEVLKAKPDLVKS